MSWRTRQPVPHVCTWCGAVFPSPAPHRILYCTPLCRRTAATARAHGWQPDVAPLPPRPHVTRRRRVSREQDREGIRPPRVPGACIDCGAKTGGRYCCECAQRRREAAESQPPPPNLAELMTLALHERHRASRQRDEGEEA